jgi:hypothetical protein
MKLDERLEAKFYASATICGKGTMLKAVTTIQRIAKGKILTPIFTESSIVGELLPCPMDDHSFFAFSQRARAALRANSLRCSAVICWALARPPFFPRETAAGFFLLGMSLLCTMPSGWQVFQNSS